MTDRDVVLRKLGSIREHVSRMRRRRGEDLDAFRADVDRQDALAMSLLVAVQDALDVALHVASDERWGLPASYAEAFEILRDHEVIEPSLAQSLTGMAALRNRLAHGYASVEAERLWRELPEGMDALERLTAAVAERLDDGAP